MKQKYNQKCCLIEQHLLTLPHGTETQDKSIRRLLPKIHGNIDRARAGKVKYGLLLLRTQDRLPKKFVKIVRDRLYELRTEYAGNIYRVFFIFDEGQVVVLFNGFQKKTQKLPNSEIEKALKIKEAYYADKQSSVIGL